MSNCKAFACATSGCQATIHLHHDIEQRLRRTHETFYCPAGHSNYFPGKTAEEKRIAELTRKTEQLEDRVERWRELYDEKVDECSDWKLVAKACPFGCGYRVHRKSKPESIQAALIAHLMDVHAAHDVEPVEALA